MTSDVCIGHEHAFEKALLAVEGKCLYHIGEQEMALEILKDAIDIRIEPPTAAGGGATCWSCWTD